MFLQEFPNWYWFILGFLLLIVEIFVPGVFLMWWGLGAVIVGFVGLVIDITLTIKLVLFAIISVILCFIWWRYLSIYRNNDKSNEKLNERDNYMVGSVGVITEIMTDNIARAKFGDTTWRVEGEHLVIGEEVIVFSAKGITLLVKKYDPSY